MALPLTMESISLLSKYFATWSHIYVNTSLSTFLLLLAYVTHIVAYLCTHTVLRASHNKGKVCQPPLVLLWATPTTLA